MSEIKTYELSKIQHLIWEKFESRTPWLGIAFTCNQRLEKKDIQKQWLQLVEQHQILGTTFVIPEQSETPLQTVDLNSKVIISEFNTIDSTETIEFFVKAHYENSNSNIGDWIVLFEEGENKTKLFFGASKLSTDKWSLIALVKLFLNQLNGVELEETLPYAQFSEWLKNAQDEQDIQAKRFWKERALTEKTNAILNNDTTQTSTVLKTISTFSKNTNTLIDDYRSLCFAMVGYILSKHTNKDDIQVKWLCDGRYFDELNPIQGTFAVECPLHINVKKDLKALQLEIKEELEDQLGVLATIFPSQEPVSSNILLEYWKDNEGLETDLEFIETSNLEGLKFEFVEKKSKIQLIISYNTEQYTSEYINCFSEQVCAGLESFLKTPAQVSLVSETAKHRLKTVFKGEEKLGSPNIIFNQLAAADTNLIAITYGNAQLTYGELLKNVNKFAAIFASKGITKGDKVCLYMGTTPNYIISLLGLWKIGAVVIPVNTTTPMSRLEFCIKLSEALFVISEQDLELENVTVLQTHEIEILADEQNELDAVTFNNNDAAYILFTSGSTGEPKGCMLSHGNLGNYLTWASDYYIDKGTDKANFPFFTSIGFDFTFTSILLPLVNNGCITVLNDEKTIDEQLRDIASNEALEFVKLTPSHIRILENLNLEGFKPKKVIVGGEALHQNLIQYLEHLNPNIKIYNEYGPTEATIGCIVTQVTSKTKETPVGSPIYNTGLYIVDGNTNEVPEHVIGEFVLSGNALATGYINPEHNSLFVNPNDKIEERHYFTGDLGYRDVNGQAYFIGRKDHQVKIRGNRIEPGEIKTIAELHHSIKEAIVDIELDKEMISLYVITEGVLESQEIREWLTQHLMAYMLPNAIIHVSNIPLNTNGKTDFKELRKLKSKNEISKDFNDLTHNKHFILLKALWEEILHVEKVLPTDHFIRLGGDSIKAIQLVNKLKSNGVDVNIRDVLEHPQLGELCEYLGSREKEIEPSEFKVDQGEVALNPSQLAFLESAGDKVNGFNQTVCLEMPERVHEKAFYKAVQLVLKRHPLLNARYKKEGQNYKQYIAENTAKSVQLKSMSEEAFENERETTAIYECINIEEGPITLIYIVSGAEKDTIHLYSHHLVIDGVSWRILVEDLNIAYKALIKEEAPKWESHQSYYNARVQHLKTLTSNGDFKEHKSFWDQKVKQLSNRTPWIKGPFIFNRVLQDEFYLDQSTSEQLKGEANKRFNTQPIELLLTAIARSFLQIEQKEFACLMENHGRQYIDKGPNAEGTLGWFTSVFPILVNGTTIGNLEEDIKQIQSAYRAVPENGLSFSYLYDQNEINTPEIQVNYLGVYEENIDSEYKIGIDDYTNQTIHPELDIKIGLNLSIIFGDKGLHVVISYDSLKVEKLWLDRFSNSLKEELIALAAFCIDEEDLAAQMDYKDLNENDLENILGELR
jgi:amino acid adenylation domain-containing protein